jgi:uncharacterized membrane protein YfhO
MQEKAISQLIQLRMIERDNIRRELANINKSIETALDRQHKLLHTMLQDTPDMSNPATLINHSQFARLNQIQRQQINDHIRTLEEKLEQKHDELVQAIGEVERLKNFQKDIDAAKKQKKDKFWQEQADERNQRIKQSEQ